MSSRRNSKESWKYLGENREGGDGI